MNRPKVVYLAGPYSHRDPMVKELRYLQLLKAEVHLLTRGYVVLNPIGMCHNLTKIFGFEGGYESWKVRDRTLISLTDGVVCLRLDGWKESVGVQDELAYAKRIGKFVEYLDVEDTGFYKKDIKNFGK